MTIEPPLSEELPLTMKRAVAMAVTTNPCWYLQSCEFNGIRPKWLKAPVIGLGGNLLSFTGCMSAYTVTYHGYKSMMNRFSLRNSEYHEFLASLIAGISASIWVIPGESRSVQSYAAEEYNVKPLTPLNRTLAFRAMWAGWKPTFGRDVPNYMLIFYGGPRFDHFAQRVIPEIGATGGAIFACGCSSILTVLLTNTMQHTRMNQQTNAWLRAAGREDLATKSERWWSVVKHTYRQEGFKAVAFKGSRWRLAGIAIMQAWERVIHN